MKRVINGREYDTVRVVPLKYSEAVAWAILNARSVSPLPFTF